MSLKDLKKKYPEAYKLSKKFLDSECCNEDKDNGKKKKKNK